MVHWKLKDCPRCGGDVYIDRDLDSWYEQCLQCSQRREISRPEELDLSMAAGVGAAMRGARPRRERRAP